MNSKIDNFTAQKVIVSSNARLHFGFYDLSFGQCLDQEKQRFGSVGLSINAPKQQIVLGLDETTSIKSSPELAPILQHFCQQFAISAPVFATVQQAIPRHTGLGSGTQMALALGAGLNQLLNLNLTVAQIAQVLMRGARSGIGIAAFAQGGFLVDAGKSDRQQDIPKILERLDFPPDWRIILVSDEANIGVHGEPEKQAFNSLPKIKNNLQDIVFKGLLPALKRQDLLAFGAYMSDLQAYNGGYFAPVQGGIYASKKVENVLSWLQNKGVACVGQSSWGPTGFAIVESQACAEELVRVFEAEFGMLEPLTLQITRACNHGATISN